MHFFDYSLWNHYVNVLSHYYRWHDFFTCLLLCLRLGHLSYLFIIFLLWHFLHFDHIDIHKKARHEISLMSGKIEICARRLEDYQTLRHNAVNISDVIFISNCLIFMLLEYHSTHKHNLPLGRDPHRHRPMHA